MTLAVWLGGAAPARSIRWLDGALATAAKISRLTGAAAKPIAIAGGDPSWLDLAAERATRAGLGSAGVFTDLSLDYLGWAQIVVAVVREIGATTILVDEASRPERVLEVAAIAELLDSAQLTNVVALAGEGAVLHASRAAGTSLQSVRIHGPAVIGLRVAGPAIEDYPTPMPAMVENRRDLRSLGLDPVVLGHRAVPRRAPTTARITVERVAEYLAVHVVSSMTRPRGG